MVITYAWCEGCQQSVIPDVRFEAPEYKDDICIVKCRGWFCPICGESLMTHEWR